MMCGRIGTHSKIKPRLINKLLCSYLVTELRLGRIATFIIYIIYMISSDLIDRPIRDLSIGAVELFLKTKRGGGWIF
jgi:hypothetical protein